MKDEQRINVEILMKNNGATTIRWRGSWPRYVAAMFAGMAMGFFITRYFL